MFDELKAKLERKAASKGALATLAAVAFVESSFFPIPPDALLIPMVLFRKENWVRDALVCTLASVAGGMLGYLIGYQFFDRLAVKLIDFYHARHQFELVSEFYRSYDFFAVFAAGFTPIPYKVFTIAAGLFKMNLATFTLASAIGRGGRFFLEAWLIYRYGERAARFIERHFALATMVLVLLVLAVLLVWRLW